MKWKLFQASRIVAINLGLQLISGLNCKVYKQIINDFFDSI